MIIIIIKKYIYFSALTSKAIQRRRTIQSDVFRIDLNIVKDALLTLSGNLFYKIEPVTLHAVTITVEPRNWHLY